MISSPLIPPFNFRRESLFAHPFSLGQIPMKGHHSAPVSVLMVQVYTNSDAKWLDVLNSINIPPDSNRSYHKLPLSEHPRTRNPVPCDLPLGHTPGFQLLIPTRLPVPSHDSLFRRTVVIAPRRATNKHGQRTNSPATATASTSSSTESLPAWAQPISKKLHSSSTTSVAKGTPPTHLGHD
jgi:hypothetical protein